VSGCHQSLFYLFCTVMVRDAPGEPNSSKGKQHATSPGGWAIDQCFGIPLGMTIFGSYQNCVPNGWVKAGPNRWCAVSVQLTNVNMIRWKTRRPKNRCSVETIVSIVWEQVHGSKYTNWLANTLFGSVDNHRNRKKQQQNSPTKLNYNS